MPHPVPLIIGTTLAVIGSGYAFKKFIYDPHLAPLIDALIAQHRENQRHWNGYEPIPVAVQNQTQTQQHNQNQHPQQHPHVLQEPIPPSSSGRSSAVDSGQHRVSRRRRPAEMYELDDTRIMPDEKMPLHAAHPRVSADGRHPASAGGPMYHPPPPPRDHRAPHQPYQTREMRRPPPSAARQPQPQSQSQSQSQPQPLVHHQQLPPPATRRTPRSPIVMQPTPRRIPPTPMLINIDAVATHAKQAAHARSPLDPDQTPLALRPSAPLAAETCDKAATGTASGAGASSEAVRPMMVSGAGALPPADPFVSADEPVDNAATTVHSSVPTVPLPPSRQSSHSTIMVEPAAASPATAPISLVASPAPSTVSNLSHLSQISRMSSGSPYRRPASASMSVSDDLEIVSVSGTTTSYVDAETYTPRSPRSPASPATPLSRTMSPPVHIDTAALGSLAGGFAHPLSTENLSLASLNLNLNLNLIPEPVAAPSVSSWDDDEHWRSDRSDSEWDALSDAGPAQ